MRSTVVPFALLVAALATPTPDHNEPEPLRVDVDPDGGRCGYADDRGHRCAARGLWSPALILHTREGRPIGVVRIAATVCDKHRTIAVHEVQTDAVWYQIAEQQPRARRSRTTMRWYPSAQRVDVPGQG
jgi:hypothetical protein